MAEKYVDQFRANIDYTAKELLAIVVRDAQAQLALSKAYRAREIARDMVRQDFGKQYTKVRCYYAELRKSNLGTTTRVGYV